MKQGIRIVEGNDNNVERIILSIIDIIAERGVSFIFHNTENGAEIIIFTTKENLINLITESPNYQDYNERFVNHLCGFVSADDKVSEVSVECSNLLITQTIFKRETIEI